MQKIAKADGCKDVGRSIDGPGAVCTCQRLGKRILAILILSNVVSKLRQNGFGTFSAWTLHCRSTAVVMKYLVENSACFLANNLCWNYMPLYINRKWRYRKKKGRF